jgi:hypothetical protein
VLRFVPQEREAALRQAEQRVQAGGEGALVAIDANGQQLVPAGQQGGAVVANAGNNQLGEWIEYWDDEVQSYYYYNPATQEASWTPPESDNSCA